MFYDNQYYCLYKRQCLYTHISVFVICTLFIFTTGHVWKQKNSSFGFNVQRRPIETFSANWPNLTLKWTRVCSNRLEPSPRRALHFFLQFHLFFFALEILHDFKSLMLDQTTLLDVEFFLGFGVDFFGLLVGFLLDEGHHVFDLRKETAANAPVYNTARRVSSFIDIYIYCRCYPYTRYTTSGSTVPVRAEFSAVATGERRDGVAHSLVFERRHRWAPFSGQRRCRVTVGKNELKTRRSRGMSNVDHSVRVRARRATKWDDQRPMANWRREKSFDGPRPP